MTPEERDRLTRLEERTARLHDDVVALLAEQKKTNDFLAEIRGGRKALWKMLTLASAAGALVGWLADKLIGTA